MNNIGYIIGYFAFFCFCIGMLIGWFFGYKQGAKEKKEIKMRK